MKPDDLLNQVSCGEDSTHQFKADVRNADSLASEMAAFANSEGGTVYLGVADDGSTPGLDQTNVARINQLISNAASQHVAKGLLPYHGLGSGIKRALAEWPRIDFADDRDGCLFTAIVHRNAMDALELVDISPKGSLKTNTTSGKSRESVGKASSKVIEACREKPSVTIPELAELIGITERSVQRNIQKLQQAGLLRRVGGRKEGYWEVLK